MAERCRMASWLPGGMGTPVPYEPTCLARYERMSILVNQPVFAVELLKSKVRLRFVIKLTYHGLGNGSGVGILHSPGDYPLIAQ